MLKNWIFFLAQNYLLSRSRKEYGGISLIFPSAGIALGVTTLIVILTGMNGFQSILYVGIREIASYHLQVELQEDADLDQVKGQLLSNQKIRAYTTFKEAPMLLSSPLADNNFTVPIVRAVANQEFMADLGRRSSMTLVQGSDELAEERQILIGHSIAYNLALGLGDSIALSAIIQDPTRGLVQLKKDFVISGVFRSDYPEIDANYVFIPFSPYSAELLMDTSYKIGLKVASIRQEARLSNELEGQALRGVQNIQTSQQINNAFFNALRTEKYILFLLLSLVFIVVAVQILQSLKRTIYTRIDEIAMLRSIGASIAETRLIFILEAAIIGLLGSVAGLFLGFFISINLDKILFFIISTFSEVAALDNFPIVMNPVDFIIVCSSAFLSCLIAGYLGSASISKLKPASIMRYE